MTGSPEHLSNICRTFVLPERQFYAKPIICGLLSLLTMKSSGLPGAGRRRGHERKRVQDHRTGGRLREVVGRSCEKCGRDGGRIVTQPPHSGNCRTRPQTSKSRPGCGSGRRTRARRNMPCSSASASGASKRRRVSRTPYCVVFPGFLIGSISGRTGRIGRMACGRPVGAGQRASRFLVGVNALLPRAGCGKMRS